jgi:hypothetical protein
MSDDVPYEKQLEARIEELEKIIEETNKSNKESVRDKLAFKNC